MGLPLPKVVADVGPGGPLVTAMGGINALHNAMIEKKINDIKSQYLPATMQAEAASKLAYANLMGPQFLSKLLQNPGAIANMGDKAAKEALLKSINAGLGGNTGLNYLNNIPQHTGTGQPSTNNIGDRIKNSFMELIGRGKSHEPNQNALMQSQQQTQRPPSTPIPMQSLSDNTIGKRPRDGVSIEGGQWYDRNGNPVYGDEEQVNQGGSNPMELEVIGTQNPKREPTWAEKTGAFKGTIEQGEEAGKYRAQAQQDIGSSQLGLSHSGAVLNRMTDIVKNPIFQEMRSKIPFFQDKQLNYLMKTGTPEQKKLIGDFLSTAESFIASTVQGFSGKPLVREFDLAQRQKINPNDPIHVAEGKLHSAIALHDIAEKKNDIISGLLERGFNLSDAVKQSNKMVDVSAIEKRTDELLRDKPTEEDIKYMAEKYKMSPAEIRKKLKAQGVL